MNAITMSCMSGGMGHSARKHPTSDGTMRNDQNVDFQELVSYTCSCA